MSNCLSGELERAGIMKIRKKHIYLLVFTIICPIFVQAQTARKRVAEGNQQYQEKKYDEASNKYQDAMLADPGSPLIHFNMGDALYKKNDYEKALESYQKSLDSDDALFQSKSYYNIGNTLYRMNKLPESILAYEQALKLNPDDEEAKYNLEFVRNKMKENSKPQQQDQQQQQQQQKQQQNQNEQKDQNQQQQKKDQQEQQQQEQKQQQQEQQRTGEEQKKEMTKEQAKQLLEALKENQENAKKKKVNAQGRVRVEKDW